MLARFAGRLKHILVGPLPRAAAPFLRAPGPPKRVVNRTTAHCALALAALVLGLEPLLVRSLGAGAPGWSHWWCSAASTSAHTPHATGGGALGGAVHRTLAVLAVHWPHFLPIVLALGTLVYLWRANEAWHAQAHGPGSR